MQQVCSPPPPPPPPLLLPPPPPQYKGGRACGHATLLRRPRAGGAHRLIRGRLSSIICLFTREPFELASLFGYARLAKGQQEIRVNSHPAWASRPNEWPSERATGSFESWQASIAHLDKHLNGLSASPWLLFTSQTDNRAVRLILKWAFLAGRTREFRAVLLGQAVANGITIVIESNHTVTCIPSGQVLAGA